MKILIRTLLVLLSMNMGQIYAQDDLLNLLEDQLEPETFYALATFKGSRLINGHTVMTRRKGSMEFIIAHRFGRLNSGAYELWGLDNSNVRFGLEFGLTDWLSAGFGRNSFEKTYDTYGKLALIRQQYGKRNIPFTLALFGSTAIKTLENIDPETEIPFTQRLSYTGQILLASKLSSILSIQLMPTIIHFNVVEDVKKNDLYALGVGGRIKLSKRMSINGEYYYRFSERDVDGLRDAVAIGIDLETGGHVFQFQFTNSRSMIEKGFIRETTGDFFGGDIHFGFNVTRGF